MEGQHNTYEIKSLIVSFALSPLFGGSGFPLFAFGGGHGTIATASSKFKKKLPGTVLLIIL